MRFSSVSMAQIGHELEESAAVSGASWLQTFRRVVLPLLVPGLLAGWIYIFYLSMRELSSSLLLYSPGQRGAPGRDLALVRRAGSSRRWPRSAS